MNISKNKPGPRGAIKQVQTPLEPLNLFFTDEMLEKVVKHTNSSIEPAMDIPISSKKVLNIRIFRKWKRLTFWHSLGFCTFVRHFV